MSDSPRRSRLACLTLVLLLAGAVPASAYIGPGAGFALMSSAFVLVTTLVAVLFTLLAWPFRALWRAMTQKAPPKASIARLIVVGLDGQDPKLTDQFMKEGLLPNFSALAKTGSYTRLKTTYPAVSPVAWSSFSTGAHPARHNIFDFLDRDRRTYLPLLSSTRVGKLDKVLRIGRYRIPQGPWAIALGAVRPKKDLAAVVNGLAEHLRRGAKPIRLVVTGGDTPQLRRDLGLANRLGLARHVTTLDEIAEEDLPSVLRLASVVPVLSRSEGFGLPVLEAMACGTPVIVPEDSAQAEVAGSACIPVDPDDPASVADGFALALAERETRRGALAARGRELSWDRCAERVEAIWSEIA